MPTTAEITQRYVQAHDDIANAITNKGGTVNTGDGFEDFAADIGSIPSANIQPVTILSNGVYSVSGDVDGYSPVTVTVPNTYTLSDEGKVVDNGALVSQTGITITANNTTVDTTLYNSVTVNITIPQPTLITKSITSNGTYNAINDNADGYSSVDVNVPNTYTALDEGCVVDNGALVPQSSTSINTNGTYDTTLNNSVTVAVPNSYTQSDEGKVVSNGALVSQTSDTYTANGTYDTTLIDSVTVNVAGSTAVADVFALKVGAGPATYGARTTAVLCVYKPLGASSYSSYVTGTVHTANRAGGCITSINLTGFNGTHLSDYFSNNISKSVWFYSSSTRAWTVTYTIDITTGTVSESSQVSSSYYDTTLKAFSQ